MPQYVYTNGKETKTVFQSMNEPHVYSENGIEWKRVYVNPQLNVKGSKIDPYSKKEFIDKTGRMKGTYGDLLDYSAEMSAARAEKDGEDQVKRKFFDEHEKKTGKKHIGDKTNSFENDFIKITDIDD